jgi:hypothetical protein
MRIKGFVVVAATLLAACEFADRPKQPVKENRAMTCCGPEKNSCCAVGPGGEKSSAVIVRRPLEVEFLYLDRTVCERCKGTEEMLRSAVEEAKRILGPTGVEVSLKMTHVRTEEQALAIGFLSSPTIRLMGRDSAIEVKENLCESCGDLGGCEIACRVWTWQGNEYSVPPKEMLLDAILRDAYLHPNGERLAPTPLRELPENLQKFFSGVRTQKK